MMLAKSQADPIAASNRSVVAELAIGRLFHGESYARCGHWERTSADSPGDSNLWQIKIKVKNQGIVSLWLLRLQFHPNRADVISESRTQVLG